MLDKLSVNNMRNFHGPRTFPHDRTPAVKIIAPSTGGHHEDYPESEGNLSYPSVIPQYQPIDLIVG